MDKIRANRTFFSLVFLLTCSTIVLSMITEIFIEGMLERLLPTGEDAWLVYVIYVIILFFCFFFLAGKTAQQAGRILGVRVSASMAERQEALPFLVMGYSPLRNFNIEELNEEIDTLGTPSVASNVKIYSELCKIKETKELRGNSWQQNLRSAWHHRERLKAIYVLDPSVDQFNKFKSYLDHAFKSEQYNIEIIRITLKNKTEFPFSAFDASGQRIPRTYENYEYVYEGLRRGLEMIHSRGDLDEFMETSVHKGSQSYQDEVDKLTCVDATPGQKPFSIAASVLTLNRPLKFSYVTTFAQGEDTGGDVRFYDTNVNIAGGL